MKPDFSKNNGLVPAIIQDETTLQVLMLGYMNEEAYNKTLQDGKVTFFSRSRNRLWTKGETSGNFFNVKEILFDCDNDTLLIKVKPDGPACHTGKTSCFGGEQIKGFLYRLEDIMAKRIETGDPNSYTVSLIGCGPAKVARKVGEEAVELIIEAMGKNDELFKNEAADLLYHFLLLLKVKGMKLVDIEEVLIGRSR
ncbi:MAG: bifunctional phosphoribosyl-AMP cyclohydrolase/phosphoribosyl-ATP diphosphatase HisIE [Bacteroidota bacterium]